MSFMPDTYSLAPTGGPGLEHAFLGTGSLPSDVLSIHGPLSLPGAIHSSPSNSSQSDTATTADAQLSLGSAAAAGDVTAASRPSTGPLKASAQRGPCQDSSAGHAGHAGRGGGYDLKREWMYRLVTFPHYFTPCLTCCGSSNTPKREQLMTLFDTRAPHRVFCCHCPTPKGSTGHFSASHGRDGALLQVRRSSFKNAVNANDISRFGADLSGVQQYTLNGNKIIYLAREASAKKPGHGAPPPASCTVDGRAMMDKNSLYCSLMCKMQAEDPGFTSWLDSQDPSVRIMAQVAANAPPVPTVACKRGLYSGSNGRDSSSSPKSSGSNGTMGVKDSPGGSVGGLPPIGSAAAAGSNGSNGSNRGYQAPSSSRPTKVARLTARSNSAPLTFAAAAAGGSSGGGYGGSDALLLAPLNFTNRSSNGALLEGLTSRPVARQLLPDGPNAAAVEAAARQAAVAAAAAAFSGAGTSAAAAAARDALGAAGLAPIRTGNGSPLYSSTGFMPRQNRQQQQQPGQQQQQQQQQGAAAMTGQQAGRVISAFAAAAAAGAGAAAGGSGGGGGGGGNSLLQQTQSATLPMHTRVESPRAPGLGSGAASFGAPITTSRGLPEPFLPGTEISGSIPALSTVFEGVTGTLDMGFSSVVPGSNPPGGFLGSVGDIAGLLGVSDSSSPMHPGLDSFDALFGDGSMSPAAQLLF